MLILLRFVSKKLFHKCCQLHNNTKHLLNLATWLIQSFFLYNFFLSCFRCVKEQRGATGWRASIRSIRKLCELSFLSSLQTYSQGWLKKILSAFLKNKRGKPHKDSAASSKSIPFQPNHTEPQKVVITIWLYCDEQRYVSVGVQAFFLLV